MVLLTQCFCIFFTKPQLFAVMINQTRLCFHHQLYQTLQSCLRDTVLFGIIIMSAFPQVHAKPLDGESSWENHPQSVIPSADNPTIIKRAAKNTVTPVLLNHGDVLEFTLRNGHKRTLKLLETDAVIM